ncbi:ATP/GTP-binding protein [Aspergillus undulatus]|uniref:ATP/GTP-binding protein n=1 Tax=Aspergillus undulatus TaxID=1810928 RepID=UPI003CCD7D43
MQSPSVYIIGAQCTGKTTLFHVLQDVFSREHPSLNLRVISEVARNVLKKHHFSRDDIANNPHRSLELQQLILGAQYDEENKNPTEPVLSDRSGADPIVYGIKYGTVDAREILESSPQWECLRDRMREALVILCPPVADWLKDDGVRLMARTWTEWEDTHIAFLEVLEANGIPFHVIPPEVLDLGERVQFILRLWHKLTGRNCPLSSAYMVKDDGILSEQ